MIDGDETCRCAPLAKELNLHKHNTFGSFCAFEFLLRLRKCNKSNNRMQVKYKKWTFFVRCCWNSMIWPAILFGRVSVSSRYCTQQCNSFTMCKWVKRICIYLHAICNSIVMKLVYFVADTKSFLFKFSNNLKG